MKIPNKIALLKTLPLFFAITLSCGLFAQNEASETKSKSDFWARVQFGGNAGANFGSGYTDVSLAPGAIYNFNRYLAAGLGLQGSYVSVKQQYNSYIYGGSLIGLVNPIEEFQLSVEVEQVRVNSEFEYLGEPKIKDNFWNTALFFGAGYRADNFTIGFRYNVLHDRDKSVYYEPFMPFVRVYF